MVYCLNKFAEDEFIILGFNELRRLTVTRTMTSVDRTRYAWHITYNRKIKQTKLPLVTSNSFIYRIQCYFSFCILIFLDMVASYWNMYFIICYYYVSILKKQPFRAWLHEAGWPG